MTSVKQTEEDTASSTQDLSESTAENDKKSAEEEKKAIFRKKVKYILQPRLRKVTTVSSSLGLVVQTTAEFLTVWILNTSKFLDIGHSTVTAKYELGSWITIGLFSTGELASLYPQPFTVSPHPTRIVEGKVEVFSTVGESYSIREKGCQFGKVGFRASLAHLLTKKSKETIGVWIRWLTEKEAKETDDKCQWEIVELDQNQTSDLEDFGDHEYRKFSEFIRNRMERPRIYESRLSECPLKSTIRHFGLVTDTYENKGHFSVWSPGISSENDHLGKVPIDKESGLFAEYPPAPGQWLLFDLSPKDAEKYAMSNGGGNRFFINEYMPINSPKGITVFQIGRYFRIILRCVLVKSTEDPLIYELPDFGFVLDRKSNLRSGAFMQLVLERLPLRTRKNYNVNWKVVGSQFVEVAKIDEIEATQSLITQLVPHYEAYECGTPMSTDRISYFPVYRTPLGPHNNQNRFVRNNSFDGPAFLFDNPKKKFNNSTVECTALVEKIDHSLNTAILWSFDAAANYHIVFNDAIDLEKGDMIYVTLQQKADTKSIRGFRWLIQKYEKREPTYKFSILNNRVVIYEEMTFFGIFDTLGRPILKGKHFPMIVDEQQILHSKIFQAYPSQKCASLIINGFVTRRKIVNANYDPNKINNSAEVFNWVLIDANGPPLVWQVYPTYMLPPQMPTNMIVQTASSSEIASPALTDENSKSGQTSI